MKLILKSILFLGLLLTSLPAFSQANPEKALFEVDDYLQELSKAFLKLEYSYVEDGDGSYSQIVYTADAANCIDSLLALKQAYRQKLETSWKLLKSNDVFTLQKILSKGNNNEIKEQLYAWKYYQKDISISNILSIFDMVTEVVTRPRDGYFAGDEKFDYLPENYDEDRSGISGATGKFSDLVHYALKLHNDRKLEDMH